MTLIIYCILCYIILGALGMAIGNRKVDDRTSGDRWIKYMFYLLIVAVVMASILLGFFFWTALVILFIGYVELILAVSRSKFKAAHLVVFFIYGLLASGFISFSLNGDKDQQFFIYFLVFTFDAFSQVSGQIIGQRKLVPAVSPGKTVEGLIGGVCFCLVSAISAINLVGLTPTQAILAGLLVSVTAFAGDVLASALKRQQGIKDYSKLLPGQGGFLDRFDSLIMTSACASLFGRLFFI
jgi:phosphatidate cytidylyltransferase